MSSERFHKAAKDNILEILKETSRKDCNTRDDSGMTPTLWAAYEGHIDALRLLVARGGEPDKADYFGNTALHLSSARGHELCVRFLVKFGCNIWSLDIDRHSARELAAINCHERILQFLDMAQADQEINNRKKSRLMKEKAEKDAEKRLKDYVKRQKVIESRVEKEQKKLLKARLGENNGDPQGFARPGSVACTYKGRMKPPPTYSDIVGTATTRRPIGAVGKKALARRAVDDFKVVEIEVDGKKSVRSLQGLRRDNEVMYVGAYNNSHAGTMLNSSRSVFQSSQNLNRPVHHQQQQPQSENQAQQILRRGKISDVWGTLNRARSTPDLLGDRCLEEEEDEEDEENDERSSVVERGLNHCTRGTPMQLQEPASIFNRPGFGSVAFRRSIAATLDNLPVTQVEVHRQPNGEHLYPNGLTNGENLHKNGLSNNNNNGNIMNNNNNNNNNGMSNKHNNINYSHSHSNGSSSSNGCGGGHNNEEISIGSAGSLARRQSMWDDDLLSEDDETDEEWTPLQRFLVANNLSSIHAILESEQIDLEALMLLTESDVAALKLPLGPRRKLLHAIASRKKALETQETVIKDIKL
ncbi:Usher syndrome type-1G protein homolog isoform X1 [Copidosoma floridanum]|uniref:Usher syndrome type-1G protein homolog isoform X1 n=1 Tax=Copidosoma floridanum TaxID=29053 RepID=UPI0006C96153|nr:Usher syndrome type-1G protein homolog isoform X1 [Copidosoma floridanum]